MSYWRIVHNLVRQDETPEETERATQACNWMADNILRLRRVCTTQQIEILKYISNFWHTNKCAPSFAILKETIERKSAAPGVLEVLAEYDEEEGLTIFSANDLGQLLTDLVEEWQSERLAVVLKTTRAINSGTWKDPKTKKEYQGPKEAAKYLLQQVESGFLSSSSNPAINHVLNEDGNKIKGMYEISKAERMAGNHRIGTGIPEIDSHITIKRGDFVGVLGYAGQRKSTLCRTIAYNAAKSGFNVLHVTLEQTSDEELSIYGLMHSLHPKFREHAVSLTKRKFDDGNLCSAEERFLFDVVIPDLENLSGRLLIRQPTGGSSWQSIKMMAEVINQTTPIDLFFIDYLTLVSTTSVRDAKSEMEMTIKDAKQAALQFGNGHGVVFLTPIQGNRKGYEEAKNSDGVWDMTGVYEYSEFDKSADLILSTFIDDILQSDNSIAISSVKIRRAAPIPLFKTIVDSRVGLIGSPNTVDLGSTFNGKDQIINMLENDSLI